MEIETGFSVVELIGMSELPYTGFLTCSFFGFSLPSRNFLLLQNMIIMITKIPKTTAPPTAAPITVPLLFPLVLALLLPGPSITPALEDTSVDEDDFDGSTGCGATVLIIGFGILVLNT